MNPVVRKRLGLGLRLLLGAIGLLADLVVRMNKPKDEVDPATL